MKMSLNHSRATCPPLWFDPRARARKPQEAMTPRSDAPAPMIQRISSESLFLEQISCMVLVQSMKMKSGMTKNGKIRRHHPPSLFSHQIIARFIATNRWRFAKWARVTLTLREKVFTKTILSEQSGEVRCGFNKKNLAQK